MAEQRVELIIEAENQAGPVLEQVADSIRETGEASKQSEQDMQSLEKSLKKLGLDFAEIETGINRFERSTLKTFEEIASNSEASSKVISAAFNAAFGRIKSPEGIRQLENDLERLKQEGRLTEADMRDLDAQLNKLGQESRETAGEVKPLTDSLNDVADAADQLGGGGGALGQIGTAIELLKNPAVAAAGAVVGLMAAFGDVNKEYQDTISLLTALTGSQEKASNSMEYARIVANELGADINETAIAYQTIESAMSRTGASTTDVRALFESLSNAILRTGGTMEDVRDGGVEMLNEGMVEGTINGEALQEMLGGAMVPALEGMANAAGVTVEQMGDMLNKGIDINKFLPLLQKGLENAFPQGPIEGFDSAVQRVKNNITTLLTDKELGIFEAFTGLIEKLADGIEGASKEIEIARATFTQWFTVFDAWKNSFSAGWDATQEKIRQSNETLKADLDAIEFKYSAAGKAAAKKAQDEQSAAQITATVLSQQQKQLDDLITGYDRLGSKSDAVLNALTEMLNKVDFSNPKKALEDIGNSMSQIILKSPELASAMGEGLAQAFSKLSQTELDAMLKEINNQIKDLPLNVAESAGLITEQNALIEASAAKVEEQYQKLGVNSAETLRRTAAEMAIAYGQMKKSGLESIETVDAAFLSLAKAEIESANAAGKSVPEYIRMEAASRGLSNALDKLIEASQELSPELEAMDDKAKDVKDAFLDNIQAFDDETESKRDSMRASIALAEAKGDEAKAARLSIELAEYELERNRMRIQLNNQLIEALDIQVNAIYAAANADGEYSKAEQEVVSNLIDTINAIKVKNAALQNQIPIQEQQIEQSKKKAATIGAESDKTKENTSATKENTDETNKNTESKKAATSAGKGMAAVIASQINYWRQETKALSEATLALFEFYAGFKKTPDVPKGMGVSDEASKAASAVEHLNKYIAYTNSLWVTSSGSISDLMRKIEVAGASAKKAYYEQKLEAENLIAANERLARTGQHGLASMGAAMENLKHESMLTVYSFNLLNEQDLKKLQNSIDAAREKLESMKEEADDARKAIEELNAEILEEKGDTAASEELKLQIERQEKLKEATLALEKAKLENNRELIELYEEQIRKINELYDLKQRNNKLDEEERKREEERNKASSSSGSSGARNSGATHTLQLKTPSNKTFKFSSEDLDIDDLIGELNKAGLAVVS